MFNWPFAKRGATLKSKTSYSEMPSVYIDFSQYSTNDAYIKVWLPERLILVLNGLSASYGSSRPDVIKTLLFRHVFGIATFESFISWKSAKDQEAAASRKSDGPVKLSPQRSQSIEYIGKSTENLKVWLPAKLKSDLMEQATVHSLGVSDYVRMILVKALLGERFYNSWQSYIGAVPAEVMVDEREA